MAAEKDKAESRKQAQQRKEDDRLDLEAYRNLHKAEFGFNPPNLTIENARQYFEQLDKQEQLDLQEQVAKEERDKKDRLKKQQFQDQERDKKDRLEKEQFQKQEFDKKERLKKEQFQKQELQKQAEKQRLDARNQLKTAAPVRQSSRRTQPKKRTFTAFRDMKAQHARDRGGRDREDHPRLDQMAHLVKTHIDQDGRFQTALHNYASGWARASKTAPEMETVTIQQVEKAVKHRFKERYGKDPEAFLKDREQPKKRGFTAFRDMKQDRDRGDRDKDRER